jgi:hypothetical protein
MRQQHLCLNLAQKAFRRISQLADIALSQVTNLSRELIVPCPLTGLPERSQGPLRLHRQARQGIMEFEVHSSRFKVRGLRFPFIEPRTSYFELKEGELA